MSVPPLLVLGNANVDLVMGEVDGWPAVGTEVVLPRSEMRPGGSAGNTALALAGMGLAHRYIAAIGNDFLGAWLEQGFDAASTEWIRMACPTTITVGIVHEGGDRAFFTSPGHLQEAGLEDLLERIAPAPDANSFAFLSGGFLMPRIADGTQELLRRLKEQGWRTALDPGWPNGGWDEETRLRCREWLAVADYALLNEEEMVGIAGQADFNAAFEALSGLLGGSQTLVIKRGSEGAMVISAGSVRSAKAPQVDVIDTVGAGDTFNAAFIATLSQGGDLGAALESGVAAASLAISTFPRRYRIPPQG